MGALNTHNNIGTIIKNKYQNSAHWEFEILDSPQSKNFIKFQVKSVSIPYTQLQIKTANTGNRYVTGYEPEGNFSISFYDNVNMDVQKYLLNWRLSIFDNSRRVFNLRQEKSMRLWLFHYDEKGEKQESLEFQFGRTKITGLGTYELNYDGSDPLITTGNFISDYINITPATVIAK